MRKRKIVIIAAVIVVIATIVASLFILNRQPTPNAPQKTSKKDTVTPTVQLHVTAAALETAKTTKTLNVSATAKDDRAVAQVDYQLDKKVAGKSTKAPYSIALDISKLAVGDHTLQAFAYDAAGNSGKSEPFVFRLSENRTVTPANPQSQAIVGGSPPATTPTPDNQTPPPPGGGDTPPPPGGSVDCSLPAYPDASCTGVPGNTTLAVINSDMNVNTADTIIEGKNINGCVVVNAPNVIIRKSKITCYGDGIYNNSTNLLIEDVEISCSNKLGGTGITWQNYTARRVNVHSCDNVIWAQNNVLIEDSYIHDPITYDPITDPHTDSIQIPDNASNITIRHNRIYGNYESPSSFGNSAITAQGGGDVNVLIQDNLLAGGGYTLACYDAVGNPTVHGPNTNFRIINNHFSTIFVSTVGGFGPWVTCDDETQVTGNVYHETGLPVPF